MKKYKNLLRVLLIWLLFSVGVNSVISSQELSKNGLHWWSLPIFFGCLVLAGTILAALIEDK